MTKQQVREQFGANAAAYVSSPTHAQGASLARLVECVAPQAEWRGLDLATAAGHTAWLLYTSDAADERSRVGLGGRRIIQKKKHGEDS